MTVKGLKKEIAFFERRLIEAANPKTPRDKATLTRIKHCLARRRRQLSELNEWQEQQIKKGLTEVGKGRYASKGEVARVFEKYE